MGPLSTLSLAPPPAAPDMLRETIQRYDGGIVDLYRASYGHGDVQEGDPSTIVGVVVNKVVSDHKPLDLVDDNIDLGDPKEATGLICWILFDIFTYILFFIS